MLPVEQPFKTYTGLDGKPLSNGSVYFGEPDQDPITHPVTVYWDAAGTLPAAQPLRTLNGYIVNDSNAPANVFYDSAYSETVIDSKGRTVFYAPTSDDFSIASFVVGLAKSFGSSLIGFIQSGAGAVLRTVQSKLRDRVSVFDFMTSAEIADVQSGTASLDVTAAMQAARDYIAINRIKLVFPSGTYRYSTSPNWAIRHAEILFEGDVRLRYTGTDNAVVFDANAADAVVFVAGLCYGTKFGWGTRPIIEAPSTAGHGIYAKGMQRAKIGARVRGCGSTSAGLRVDFSVCTEFDVVVSGNFDGWYSGAKPQFGYYLDRRNPGETTSYCSFVNPVVEGPTIGVQLNATLGNVFVGGTFEACSQYGVYAAPGASQDRFIGTDFEVNTLADVYDLGSNLVIHDCDTYSQLTFGTQSKNATVRGGKHSKVLFDTGCLRPTARDIVFNRFNDGSGFTDAATGTIIDGCRNGGTNTNYLTGIQAVGAVGIANNALGVTSITVTGAKLGDFVTVAFDGGSLGAMITWGVINSANTVTAYCFNNTGALVNVNAGNWKAYVTRR